MDKLKGWIKRHTNTTPKIIIPLDLWLIIEEKNKDFELFVKKSDAIENLNFLNRVLTFEKSVDETSLSKQASDIFNDFIKENSKYEINIDHITKKHIEENIKIDPPSLDTFRSAKYSIFKLVNNDIFPRYLNNQEKVLQKSESVEETRKIEVITRKRSHSFPQINKK